MKLAVILAVISFISVSNGARILGIFPIPFHSHSSVFKTLSEALLKKGHHMTIIAAFPEKYEDGVFQNLTVIDVYDLSYEIYIKTFDFERDFFKNPSQKEALIRFYNTLMKLCEVQFTSPEVQKLLDDKSQHFDLIIAEAIMPVVSTLKEKYNAPLIFVTTYGFAPYHFDNIGNPVHPVLYPDNFAPYDPLNMKIWEKINLLYRYIAYELYHYVWYVPKFNDLQRKIFGPHHKSVTAIENEADLMLVTYNPIWNGVMPLVPVAVDISGLHIKPPKSLPDHLQKLLDDSPEGVIFFSFGSHVEAKNLPEDKRSIFVETFRKMPYKIIWKWEDENLPRKPDNVYISKWLPQMDILAHPNVKVLITHGGQQSVEESLYNGVPMLSIPLIFDQIAYAFRIVKHGVGKSLSLDEMTEKSLEEALLDIINNPKYHKNAVKLHKLIQDQPQTSIEKAIWWTEYVIRHKGARHLRSPAADASFIQYHMLDCLLFIIVSIGLPVYFLILLKRSLFNYNIKVKTNKMKSL